MPARPMKQGRLAAHGLLGRRRCRLPAAAERAVKMNHRDRFGAPRLDKL